jgi:subtilisin family serine protease
MSPCSSVHASCADVFRTRRRPVPPRSFAAAILASVCLAILQVLPVSVVAGDNLTPPPVPSLAPVITRDYGNDADRNRIDDQLDEKTAGLGADAKARGLSAQAEESMPVELIFSEPVTQSQIDAFTGLGGSIIYMYQAVSYGWIGRIPLDRVSLLPSAMGATLVLVEPTSRVKLDNTDRATSGGRVRPVWKPGFAGNASGFIGDSNTTIAFMDTGVDSAHRDLAGRLVYWNDLSSSKSSQPRDDYGHGTAVAGMALGTGEVSGVNAGPFTFTYTNSDSDYGQGYNTDPIGLASGTVTITTKAWWAGPSATLAYFSYDQGTPYGNVSLIGSYSGQTGYSVLTDSFNASDTKSYIAYLFNAQSQPLSGAVLVNTVSTYPAVGDGFPRFQGVAPGCKYAMARIPTDATDMATFENSVASGLDLLVTNRIAKNIKIISLSFGFADEVTGSPKQNTSFRNKITSAVNSGIIVTISAGNAANATSEAGRAMADPARAALAITVGASNEKNALTEYSTYGFANPSSVASEDFKPDIIAPGGSFYYSSLALPDSGTSDAFGADKEPNDYTTMAGTSFSCPFVAGCAAVLIQAMERKGIQWDFTSSQYPRYVKMVLCATASETNANRESGVHSAPLQRAAAGPDGFPSGKDRYEGYGMVNLDAAVEAVTLTYSAGSAATETFGSGTADRRVWARMMDLKSGRGISVTLNNPTTGDFDLYLYSNVPGDTGTPILMASGTTAGNGGTETLTYSPSADGKALLVVKQVAGSGAFTLKSTVSGPPLANDVQMGASANTATTTTLDGIDDGLPNPPGSLTYTIASLPQHGQLEQVSGGAVISTAPAALATGVKQVVYRPNTGWVGADSFTFYCDDGGTSPSGGRSNTATVTVTTSAGISVAFQVAAGGDDAYVLRGASSQKLTDAYLSAGLSNAGMRFTGVSIPAGATIVKADLKVRAYTTGLTTTFTGTICAEAADNASDFNTLPINSATTTTAVQSWPLGTGTSWTSGTWYQSPDIAAVVREVISRPGWSKNNALAIIFQGSSSATNDRKFWSYDGDPTSSPQLEITYLP